MLQHKRLFAGMLAATMTLSLTACGSKTADKDAGGASAGVDRLFAEIAHGIYLVFHQGYQGRNHNGRPLHHKRRQLITQRFSSSGRHQYKSIISCQHIFDDCSLISFKGIKTKMFFELFCQIILLRHTIHILKTAGQAICRRFTSDFSNFSFAYSNVTWSFFLFADGILYMASIITASTMERKPRAPNLNSSALSTINSNTSSSNVSLISSIANNLMYCLMIEFFGSVRILRSVLLSNGFK